MNIIRLIKCGLGFLSSIPVGISMDEIEMLMKNLYIYPIIGTILGVIIGLCSFIFYNFFCNYLATVFVICLIYYLTFFNHLDGVGDFGDGITAHGSIDKKRRALKDTALGIGGVSFICFYILLLYFSILSLHSVSYLLFLHLSYIKDTILFGFYFSYFQKYPLIFLSIVLLLAEISAKQSMLTISSYGNFFHEGLGSVTIKGAKGDKKALYIGICYSFSISFLLLGIVGIVSFCMSILSSFYILNLSNRHFHGLNGDGIGCANEFSRLIFMISIIFIFKVILIGELYTWM